MKISLKYISVVVLLAVGVAEASAGPSGDRREGRDFARVIQSHRVDAERNHQRSEPQFNRHAEGRPSREFGVPDGGRNTNQANNIPGSPPEASRRQGRLTPDERRALRRQIDEAGHDIYAPKR